MSTIDQKKNENKFNSTSYKPIWRENIFSSCEQLLFIFTLQTYSFKWGLSKYSMTIAIIAST